MHEQEEQEEKKSRRRSRKYKNNWRSFNSSNSSFLDLCVGCGKNVYFTNVVDGLKVTEKRREQKTKCDPDGGGPSLRCWSVVYSVLVLGGAEVCTKVV